MPKGNWDLNKKEDREKLAKICAAIMTEDKLTKSANELGIDGQITLFEFTRTLRKDKQAMKAIYEVIDILEAKEHGKPGSKTKAKSV